jgi:hypothetical protein
LPACRLSAVQHDKNISQAANHKGDVLLGSSCCRDTSFLLVKKDGEVPNTKTKDLLKLQVVT